jgi:hypothetical protein
VERCSQRRRARGRNPFTCSLDLGAPELLFRGYGRRWWLTAGLILSAGVAALLALASMWRGFQRQVRLTQMKSGLRFERVA